MTASTEHTAHCPWPEHAQRLQVGDLRIDLLYRRVERPDGRTELPNRMFELLLLFLAEPHVLHTRARLFERVWQGVVVEDANLSQSVWMLRKALGPERKHWIRTIARSGYVFEPPSPVEDASAQWSQHDGNGDAARPTQPAPVSAAAGNTGVAPPPAHAFTRRQLFRVLTMAAAVACLGLIWLHGRIPVQAAPQSQIAVALIEVGDRAASDSHWPARLLHAWLGWKLANLPEAVLLTEAHLAADASTLSPTVVLLSSGHASGRADEIFVRARLGQGPDGETLEVRGAAAQAPALIDDLSQQVLRRLLPSRADARWPELAIDTAAARGYGDAHDAFKARDWPTAVDAMQGVVQQAPRFGLARLELALAQSQLGQSVGAREQMAVARELLRPVPEDAEPLLEALALSVDPQRVPEAAEAYDALAQAYPARTWFALEQARLLVQAGKSEQARAILIQPNWDRQPTTLRITRQLVLAQTGMLLGDYERAHADAATTERLARAAGAGWTMERGRALLMMATADNNLRRERADHTLYEQAAQEFERSGHRIHATLARYQGKLARNPDAAEDPLLDTLLADTHAGGYHHIEISLLRMVAFSHYLAGRHGLYRKRLEEELETANESGDPYRRSELDLDLLNEDLMLGDFGSAERRLQRLRDGILQGDIATWVDQFDAYLQKIRGDSAAGLAALDRAAQRAAQEDASGLPPLSAARLACARAGLLLEQGRLAPARAELARCANTDQAWIGVQADLLGASADLFAGDRTAALARLDGLEVAIDEAFSGPDRWWSWLDLSGLWTRTGHPERARPLYERILPTAREAGYEWLVALTLTGLAETAAAQGDWEQSAQHVASARRGAPTDAWLLTRRLDLLDVILAMAKGDGDLAMARLVELDAQAHRLGDTTALLEVHSLVPPEMHLDGCDRATRTAMVAETGFRGANLDWLMAPLSATQGQTLVRLDPTPSTVPSNRP